MDKSLVKKRPRHKPLNLCRVCLTYSPSLRGLNEEFDRNCGIASILDLLKKVMCCEIELTRGTPDNICSVCLSFLKISYDFKLQFEESQKKIIRNQNFGSEDNYENCKKTSGGVELIVGDKNFSLDDVVIVEEEDVKKEDYTHLLKNLGKSISVQCVKTDTPNDHGQAFDDKVVDEKSVRKEGYTHLLNNLGKAISVECVKIETPSDDGQAFDDEVVDEEYQKKEDFTDLLKNLGKNISEEYVKIDSANDYIKEQIFNEEVVDHDVIDEEISEPYFEELENPEDYETIIIEYVSETEESSEDRIEFVDNAEIKKKEKELLDRINSLIIEDEQGKPNKISPKKIRIKDPLPIAIKNKSQRKKEELAEIEKYIIFRKEDEKEICGTNGFSSNAKNELECVSSSKLGEINDSLSRIEENVHQNSMSEVKGLESYKFSCPTCFLTFKFKKTLDSHFNFVHGNSKGMCITSKEASNKSKGERKDRAQNNSKNTTTMTLEERMAIREQNRKFRKKMWNLQKNRRPLLCQICGYVSKSSGGAFYHAKTHGERNFKCKICPRQFYTTTHLKNHVKFTHEKVTSPHLCSICGESRNSYTALRYHLKLHADDPKPFSCHICNTEFVVKGALTTHLRRHLGDRRYVCSVCNKSFFTNDERRKHTMTHTGERPHKCRYCEKKFLTRYNQKVHMMSHRGPYFCKLCSRGLADRDLLNDHMNFKHFSQRKPKPVRPSKYPGPSYKEEGEIVGRAEKDLDYSDREEIKEEIYEFPQCSPATSSDNVILEVLNLLEGPDNNELRINEVNAD